MFERHCTDFGSFMETTAEQNPAVYYADRHVAFVDVLGF